ncbi:MAG: class I SAM-dependent methyltransferase [Acidimicrobiales bacterium]
MQENVDGGPCRFCGTPLTTTFVDLGMSPLCQTIIRPEEKNAMEPFFPLHTYVCGSCFLVQLQEYVDVADIFREYAYFSSYSDDWLAHARDYCETMISRLGLGSDSLVVELASNDGYLLQWFKEKGVPVLGIEPAVNVAQVAIDKGIPTRTEFFGADFAAELAAEGVQADLVLGNNVLAQVPDINDFVAGIPKLLKPTGTMTIEFPHLQRLVEGNQFDTIYHEHFSYFSLITAERIFAAHGLTIFDVEELWSHGGSIRIIARPTEDDSRPVTDRLVALREREIALGYDKLETYGSFTAQVERTKRRVLEFLIQAADEGKRVVGYGAPGKGNTMLNYCGIRTDLIEFTVDRNPYKQGCFLPGTRIPVLTPEAIDEAKPDYIFILPWNLRDEIATQLAHAREWGAQFVVPIPELEVF